MKSHRALSMVLAVALVAALLTPVLVHASSYYYESVTVSQGEKQKRADEMKIIAWVDGPKSKVQFVGGAKKGIYAEGSYLVTKDGGEAVYYVDPKEETYALFDIEQMMAMAGQMMEMMEQMGGMMKMEFTNTYNEMLLEEPGESIHGRSTTHYRYKSGYTMSMKMMGFKQQTTIDSIQDLWCTQELDSQGFGIWLRPDRNMKTGNDEFDNLINTEMEKIRGFPLKTATVSTTTNKKGKSVKNTATTEVVVLREETIADSTFGWPSHYTETQMVPEMPEGYGDQQAEGGKKKKKKGGLSGLFKKPDDDG